MLNAQTITTYATVATPAGLVFDGTGNLYVAQYAASGNVIKVNTSGVASTFTQTTLTSPTAIVTDGLGNFYVNLSSGNTAIRKINSAGVVSNVISGVGQLTLGLAIDATSNFYAIRAGGAISKVTTTPTISIFVSGLISANAFGGMAFDAAGNLYAGYNSIVYKITPAGVVSTLATLSVSNINSLAMDAVGNIFLGGSFSGIYKVTPTGTVSAIASLSSLSNIYGLTFDASGNLFASSFSNNTIYKISSAALPVKLVALTATSATNKVAINWQSANEVNLSHFNIQRSMDGSNFTEIGKAIAKGDGGYSYTDNQLPSLINVYYRLQMVDKDGSYTYSKIVAVPLKSSYTQLTIFPNPVKETLFIQLSSTKADKLTLQITDIQGKVLQQQTDEVGIGNTSLSINTATLTKGSYILLVKIGEALQQRQFVKD